MRAYTESSEETLRARKLLTDWAADGILTKAQQEHLEQETISELRTTNIFLRLVLLFFTLIIVGSAAGLFYVAFLKHSSDQTDGIFFVIFSAVCYTAAEVAISKFRLYRYGIEEALAVLSAGFLCVGMFLAFFSGAPYSPRQSQSESLVLIVGAIFSLWIWYRFGLWYAFLAAMVFAVFLPGYWTSSHAAQHVIIALFYAAGLICVGAVRPRDRFDYLADAYSLAEAFLWLGIYVAINLQLSSLDRFAQWWGGPRAASEFARPFYWATWVVIWCLPPLVLLRGIRQKDRFVMAVGAIVTILTFVTNKPYLGWSRHTWDPMLLGILLTGVALSIRRWLSRGRSGVRHGFTAARLSGKDKRRVNAGSAVLGLVSPHSTTPTPHDPDFRFGGGSTGGGGAGGEF